MCVCNVSLLKPDLSILPDEQVTSVHLNAYYAIEFLATHCIDGRLLVLAIVEVACKVVLVLYGMVKKDLVSGVAGLAGVVWVSMASPNNRYKVDNQGGTIAPSLASLINLHNSWKRSGM